MKRFEIRLDKDLHAKLREESFKTEKSMHEIVIELIENRYNKIEKERLGMMETIFNKENLIIKVKESGGNSEYKYEFFREGFEEWARGLDIRLADVDQLERYIKECGYNVINIIEG